LPYLAWNDITTGNRRILLNPAKSFPITKHQVWEAYRRVKANHGGAGIDAQTLEKFDQDLSNNLYKLWNRMASGSYLPPPVKRVDIPKANGGTRPLGIPTVADRIAQTVVKQVLEPELEKYFHPDSYGYRPERSAHQALSMARKRCWTYNWVLEFDIKGYFDNIDHDLLMRAVRKHTQEKWVLLYIERWLKAPVQMADGTLQPRDRGTPQGGVITPLTQKITFICLCHIVLGRRFRRLRIASCWRSLSWYRIFNRNQIFSHNHLFNQQSHNSLALTNIEGIGI
jgi:group II intron reverse transcriptase/maturase